MDFHVLSSTTVYSHVQFSSKFAMHIIMQKNVHVHKTHTVYMHTLDFFEEVACSKPGEDFIYSRGAGTWQESPTATPSHTLYIRVMCMCKMEAS